MSEFRVHVLDMGNTMYGDCILVEVAGKTVLIDGGHSSDYEGQTGFDSIPTQLESILGTPPFRIDLLVVTHVHADHIGCLPAMLANNLLQIGTALVSDEKIGFGKFDGQPDLLADATLTDADRILIAASTEEDYSLLPDDELQQFLLDAVKLDKKYGDFLIALKVASDEMIRYVGKPLLALEERFNMTGLKILGPGAAHLERAKRATANAVRINARLEAERRRRRRREGGDIDSPAGILEMYRDMISRRESTASTLDLDDIDADDAALSLLDANFARDGKNNTSITLKFEHQGRSVLLAGDMQLADAMLETMVDDMTTMRRIVRENGPYTLVKTSHHTSFNGVNDEVLDDLQNTPLFVHSGGYRDDDHPDEEALAALKKVRDRIEFARTDRNGRITAILSPGEPRFEISRGELNVYTRNPTPPRRRPDDVTAEMSLSRSGTSAESILRARTNPRTGEAGSGAIKVAVEIPHERTHVTISISVDPHGAGAPNSASNRGASSGSGDRNASSTGGEIGGRRNRPHAAPLNLAGGRDLPKLLFVTQPDALIDNIGEREAGDIIAGLQRAGVDLLELPRSATNDPNRAAREVAERLQSDHRGAVLIGGYDVLPPRRLNTISDDLRERIARVLQDNPEYAEDPDSYIVWDDDGYVDRDGDGLPELPVTRIPDGRSPKMLRAALETGNGRVPTDRTKFAIRNCERPFADIVFDGLSGDGRIEPCIPFLSSHIKPGSLASKSVYLMLHGSAVDGRGFDGEGADDAEGVNVRDVKENPGSIVFCGCCWGALCGESLACEPGTVAGRALGASIALQFLSGGARAFVGCTGAHYSPPEEPDTFGGPMHVQFWSQVASGTAPAEALLVAKKRYATDLPHGLRDALSVAAERKILGQFTCLGLGW